MTKTPIRKKIKKVLRSKMFFFLILTLAVNSFAWFIYTNKIEGGIGAKVKAWNVTFKADDGSIVEDVNIEVEDLYPGKHFSKEITVFNQGDTNADLSFEIVSVTLFGQTKTATESGTYTKESLLTQITTGYPFKITPSFTSQVLEANSSEKFSLVVDWPFESGNDDLDTYWGDEAYKYNKTNPNRPALTIRIKIMAIQQTPKD